MDSDGSEAPRSSSRFNFTDSDIIIESSDVVRFYLHRKNLETHTKGFPGLDLSPDPDSQIVIHVDEPAQILEILFQFVYPRRQPILSGLELETLLALAEAVQKYQVFSAMNGCEIYLRKFVEKDALSILVHALRHYGGYETCALVDECSRHLIRKGQIFPITRRFADEGLDPNYIVRWIEYETKWEELFKKLKSDIDDIPLHEDCWTEKHLCSNCRNCLISWVDDLRDIPTIPALVDALEHPVFLKQHHKQSHDRCRYCKHDVCKHRGPLVKSCSNLVQAMPDFTTILDAEVVELEITE